MIPVICLRPSLDKCFTCFLFTTRVNADTCSCRDASPRSWSLWSRGRGLRGSHQSRNLLLRQWVDWLEHHRGVLRFWTSTNNRISGLYWVGHQSIHQHATTVRGREVDRGCIPLWNGRLRGLEGGIPCIGEEYGMSLTWGGEADDSETDQMKIGITANSAQESHLTKGQFTN